MWLEHSFLFFLWKSLTRKETKETTLEEQLSQMSSMDICMLYTHPDKTEYSLFSKYNVLFKFALEDYHMLGKGKNVSVN